MVSMWRSKGFRLSAMALAVAALALPPDVPAAGLGKLTVLSNLGEPLRADVDLDVTKEEMASLSAHVAAPAVFRKAGVDFAPILQTVKVSVVAGTDGKSVLRLASDRPVADPFLDVLLEINWAAGRLVREYTFLLDPADEAVARTPVAPLAVSRVEPVMTSVPRGAAQRPAEMPADKKPAAKAEPLAKAGTSAPAASGGGATHKVKPGETAAKIAQENLPEGVSLEQMLVAMVRGNPDAFDQGNVNRLRAGRILQLPDASSANAIGPEEAHKTLVAQSSDFSAYRRRLAGQVAAAPAPSEEANRQGASGKIGARVEEKAPAAGKPGDQLKVSRTDEPRAGAASGKAAGTKEEGQIARDKALKDANSRVAELEKNVKDLQQLLEMKNQALANGGKPAAQPAVAPPVPPAAAKPAASAAAPSASVPPQVVPPAQPAAAPAPAPAAQASQPPKPPVKKAVLPPPPPPEPPGFFESLLDSPMALFGGLGGIGALIAFAIYKRKKGRGVGDAEHSVGPLTVTSASGTPSIFGTAGGRSVDTSASAIQTDFSQSGLSAIDTDEGVDPVAEADVYMAYGRDAQAEEILLDALKHDPDRNAIRLKLLEIYAQRKSMLQFETVAGELYARTGGIGTEWEKAASLGQALDPHNPLYARGPRDGVSHAAEPDYVEQEEEPVAESQSLSDTWTQSGALDEAAAGAQGAPVYEAAPVTAAQDEALAPAQDLDFDLGLDFQEENGAGHEEEHPSFASTQWVSEHEEAPPAEEEHDHSFDSTVVLGGGGRMGHDPFADHDFHIDLEQELGQKLPEETGGVDISLDHPVESREAGGAQHAGAESGHAAGADADEHVLDFELGGSDDMATTAHLPAVDLSEISLDLSAEDAAFEPEPSAAADLAATELRRFQPEATVARDAFHLDDQGMPVMESLDVEDMAEPAVAAPPQAPVAQDRHQQAVEDASVATFDLSMEMSEARETESAGDEEGGLEESGTKLELAQAYEEMGDREGARDLLQEVVQEGTPEQQEKAKALLARLG